MKKLLISSMLFVSLMSTKKFLVETRWLHSIFGYFFCHNRPGIRVFESLLDNQRASALSVVPEESWFAHFLSLDMDFLWRLGLVNQTDQKQVALFYDRQTTTDWTTNLRQESDKLVYGSLHLLAPGWTEVKRAPRPWCSHRIPDHADLRACRHWRSPGWICRLWDVEVVGFITCERVVLVHSAWLLIRKSAQGSYLPHGRWRWSREWKGRWERRWKAKRIKQHTTWAHGWDEMSARHTLFLSHVNVTLKSVVNQRENVTCEVCYSHTPVGCSRLLSAPNDLTTTNSKILSKFHFEFLGEWASKTGLPVLWCRSFHELRGKWLSYLDSSDRELFSKKKNWYISSSQYGLWSAPSVPQFLPCRAPLSRPILMTLFWIEKASSSHWWRCRLDSLSLKRRCQASCVRARVQSAFCLFQGSFWNLRARQTDRQIIGGRREADPQCNKKRDPMLSGVFRDSSRTICFLAFSRIVLNVISR